jgi:hypothetical protein
MHQWLCEVCETVAAAGVMPVCLLRGDVCSAAV